jgi:hypothetical protein
MSLYRPLVCLANRALNELKEFSLRSSDDFIRVFAFYEWLSCRGFFGRYFFRYGEMLVIKVTL